MGRTNIIKRADAILCSDIHIRESIPIARIDDFEKAQWEKLGFISKVQKRHDCPVICAADFFHHWKASPELLSKTMRLIPNMFYTIFGDHDLPNHNLQLKHKSGLTTLKEAGKITLLEGGHGSDKNSNKVNHGKPSITIKGKKVFVWHVLTYKNELPFPDCSNMSAKKLLKKYPEYDLIVTGDNHKTFVEKHKGRLLVNAGSMMRNNADQTAHKPCVFLYYADTNTVEPVYLLITPAKDCISREHIEGKEERDNRIEAYVSRQDMDWKASMSLDKNFERFYSLNKTKKKVREIIQKSID